MARDDVEVHPVPHKTRGYVLDLFHEGRYIGEYEDSRAGEEDREAKIQEAVRASEPLLEACSQSSTCMIAVRWNSKMKGKDREKAKEIREYGLCQTNPGTDQRSSTPSQESRTGGSLKNAWLSR